MGGGGRATLFAAMRPFVRPTEARDGPIVATTEPGASSVVVRGKGTATGGALVEVYAETEIPCARRESERAGRGGGIGVTPIVAGRKSRVGADEQFLNLRLGRWRS